MKGLTAILNSIGIDASSAVRNINFGGCCVYAAIVATELEKIDVPVLGVVSGWAATSGKINIDDVRPRVKKSHGIFSWNENGVSFGHVVLEIEIGRSKKFYDSNGVVKPRTTLMGSPVYAGRLFPDELRSLAGRPAGWNRTFNRRDIPKLRKIVQQAFVQHGLTT